MRALPVILALLGPDLTWGQQATRVDTIWVSQVACIKSSSTATNYGANPTALVGDSTGTPTSNNRVWINFYNELVAALPPSLWTLDTLKIGVYVDSVETVGSNTDSIIYWGVGHGSNVTFEGVGTGIAGTDTVGVTWTEYWNDMTSAADSAWTKTGQDSIVLYNCHRCGTMACMRLYGSFGTHSTIDRTTCPVGGFFIPNGGDSTIYYADITEYGRAILNGQVRRNGIVLRHNDETNGNSVRIGTDDHPTQARRIRLVAHSRSTLFPLCEQNILQSYALEALPVAGYAGRLARVTTGPRGVWMDQGYQWFEIGGETFNVREFGATGDGVTDDTAEIQAAIDAAKVLSNGGTVYFPAGHYLCSSDAVSVGFASEAAIRPLRLTGEGYQSRLEFTSSVHLGIAGGNVGLLEICNLRFTGAVTRMIGLSGPTTPQGEIRIHDNFISGATVRDEALGAAVGGIFVNAVSDVWIERNILTGNGYAIVPDQMLCYDIVCWSSGLSRVHVRNNSVFGSQTIGGIALYSTTYSDVIGNYVDQGNHQISNNTGYGILIYGDSAQSPDRCIIADNIVKNCAGSGIYLVGGADCQVTGNLVYDAAKTQADVSLPVGGIALNVPSTGDPDGERGLCQGNTVHTSGKAGVAFNGAGMAIIGNTILDCATDGIQFRGSNNYSVVLGNVVEGAVRHGIGLVDTTGDPQGVRIIGNTIRMVSGSDRGISLRNGDNCTVQGNLVLGPSLYGIDVAGTLHLVADNHTVGCTTGVRNLGISVSRRGNRVNAAAIADTVTLASGTKTVGTAEIETGDVVRIVRLTVGSAPGHLSVGTITNHTSFVINSSDASDNGKVFWEIVH